MVWFAFNSLVPGHYEILSQENKAESMRAGHTAVCFAFNSHEPTHIQTHIQGCVYTTPLLQKKQPPCLQMSSSNLPNTSLLTLIE